MEIRKAQRAGRVFLVTKNDNGTINLFEDGKPAENAGRIINRFGGVAALLARSEKTSYTSIEEGFAAQKEHREEMQRYNAATEEEFAFKKMVEQGGGSIIMNVENIRVLLSYLNTVNWGAWGALPKADIIYQCAQHQCGTQQATTITLNAPILCEDGKRRSMFCTPVSPGYLTRYANIGRL